MSANTNTSSAESITIIEAPRGWVPLNLNELWRYRELLYFMLWRDLKARYKQSALGPLWIVLNPVLQMVLLSVIFGGVAKLPMGGIPAPLFIYSALLGMCFYYGYAASWTLLLIPVFLAMAMMVGLAIGLAFAPPIAHFWDVGNILQYVAKILMYASPVVYMASDMIPERWQTLYWCNPLANIIQGCRWAILGTEPPPWDMMVFSFAAVIPFFLAAAFYFRRAERSIVDIA